MKTLLAAVAALLGSIPAASGQTFPSRTLTLIVPFSAGGPTDTIGRIVAQRMGAALGQTVVVENVTGAGGTIAVGRVARAAPDGYTLDIGHLGTHVINGAIYELQYDVFRDFEPVAMIASNPQLIVARKGVPAKDLRELIAWVKANPEKISAANGGIGTPSHIASIYFQNIVGARVQIVPYRGAAPAMKDILAGHVDMMFDQAANSLPQVRAGTIKAYAVTASARLAAAPDIPTVDEAGLHKFYMAEERDREAQRRDRGIARRPRRAPAPGRSGTGNPGARATDARGARRASQGGNRKMVADDQGRRGQGGVTDENLACRRRSPAG